MRKISFILLITMLLASCGYAKEDNKMVNAEDIIKSINKGQDVVYTDKIIEGDLDFTQVKEESIDGNGVLTHKVKPAITFVKCVFMNKVITYSRKKTVNKTKFYEPVSFRECDFRGDVEFTATCIDGDFYINSSKFRETADFNDLTIKGKLLAYEVLAEKDFNFNLTNVNGSVNLMDAQFYQSAGFQNLICEDLQLGNLACEKNLDLSLTEVRGNVTFNYSEIKGNLILTDSRFFGKYNMFQTKVGKKLNIDYALFYAPTKIDECEFNGDINAEGLHFMIEPEIKGTKVASPFKISVTKPTLIEIK